MPGVYISYPFCRQKCAYCNFASGAFRNELEDSYLDALLLEVHAHTWNWRPETVYFGGGSPDRLEPAALGRLMALIPGKPWKEATIEVAPGEVTEEKCQCWADCGIDRVSLGVQSFVTAEIRRTGRKHTAEVVATDVDLLRQAGLRRINIDLIAGLPGQTLESWRTSLDWIERTAPGHVSVYMLEIDEDSRLGREILAGGSRYGASAMPPPDLVVKLYEAAVERLDAIGIRRYEISNFARPGEEARHNLKYWRLEPYVGFGADAHSFDGRTRSQNAKSPAEYVERSERGLRPVVAETPADLGSEHFFVGLRLSGGIVLTPEEQRDHRSRIDQMVAAGLLERDGSRLRLTRRGVLLSNEVFQEFLHE